VQPQNLLATGDGRITLIDLNVARPIGASAGGQFVGCPPYMAPELWRGEPVWPATDAYALAALVHALCAGGPPFAAASVLGQMSAHLGEAPPSLGSRGVAVSARAEAAVAAALAKDPTARPTVRELVAELVG
jgi:serine/threonine protein kinase